MGDRPFDVQEIAAITAYRLLHDVERQQPPEPGQLVELPPADKRKRRRTKNGGVAWSGTDKPGKLRKGPQTNRPVADPSDGRWMGGGFADGYE